MRPLEAAGRAVDAALDAIMDPADDTRRRRAAIEHLIGWERMARVMSSAATILRVARPYRSQGDRAYRSVAVLIICVSFPECADLMPAPHR
jgi:hypothetical protein